MRSRETEEDRQRIREWTSWEAEEKSDDSCWMSGGTSPSDVILSVPQILTGAIRKSCQEIVKVKPKLIQNDAGRPGRNTSHAFKKSSRDCSFLATLAGSRLRS
jgi:hypothetical protein